MRALGTHLFVALRWLISEVRDKLDLPAALRRLRTLGQRYGRRFFIAAIIWEAIEDGLLPLLCVHLGHPELVPLCLVLHGEPIVYPLLLWAFRTYDRIRGRLPWEPDRSAMSACWRSGAKVLLYRLAAFALFWQLLAHLQLTPWLLTGYALVMTLLGYAHERMWHDSGWGITADDQVLLRRTIGKAATYRGASFAVMAMVLAALVPSGVPWAALCAYQGAALAVHLVLEYAWSRSSLGIGPTPPHTSEVTL